MSKKEHATQVTTEAARSQDNKPRCISIAEARRKAFDASDKAQQAQVAYAEEEAIACYNYRVEE